MSLLLKRSISLSVLLLAAVSIVQGWRQKPRKRGFRIVEGKQSALYSDLVVGFFFLDHRKVCTASIVSSRFAISAVHCLRENSVPVYVNSSCHSRAPREARSKIKYCKRLSNGDTRIRVWRRGAWIIRKAPDLTEEFSGFTHYVKYIYRPKGSYFGGEYGTRGGYDIMLLKLERGSVIHEYIQENSEFHARTAALIGLKIPAPDYERDTEDYATAVGYGDSERTPCEVDGNGPSKFNYCGVEKNCDNFRNGSCKIIFNHRGKKEEGCQFSPTPAGVSKPCQSFLKAMEDDSILDDTDVALFRTSMNGTPVPITHCYTSRPSQFGWCGTVSLTNLENPDEVSDVWASIFNVSPDKGWGFCTKYCSDSYKKMIDRRNTAGSGQLRSSKRYVLNHDFCMNNLFSRLKKGFGMDNFEHEPRLLCFARNLTYTTRYFELRGRSDFRENKEPNEGIRKAFHQFPNWYIAHPGFQGFAMGTPEVRSFTALKQIHLS